MIHEKQIQDRFGKEVFNRVLQNAIHVDKAKFFLKIFKKSKRKHRVILLTHPKTALSDINDVLDIPFHEIVDLGDPGYAPEKLDGRVVTGPVEMLAHYFTRHNAAIIVVPVTIPRDIDGKPCARFDHYLKETLDLVDYFQEFNVGNVKLKYVLSHTAMEKVLTFSQLNDTISDE